MYLVTNEMLENVWHSMGTSPRLPVIAGLVDVVTSDYATHFNDIYVQGHHDTGNHLTGDRIRILLLNLPFVFRDLIHVAP
jgi:hypothetical protein